MDSSSVTTLGLEKRLIRILNDLALLSVVLDVGLLFLLARASVATRELRERVALKVNALNRVRLVVVPSVHDRVDESTASLFLQSRGPFVVALNVIQGIGNGDYNCVS